MQGCTRTVSTGRPTGCSTPGRSPRPLQPISEALALFEAQQDQPGMAETLDLLGTVYNLGGDSINAVLMYGRAIEFLRAVGNRSVLCSCLAMRATCCRSMEWVHELHRQWELCCNVSAICSRRCSWRVRWNGLPGKPLPKSIFGGILPPLDRLGAGLAHAQQGLRLATEINHQQWIACAHDTLARISLSLLAPEQALAHAEVGLEAARELGSAIWIT